MCVVVLPSFLVWSCSVSTNGLSLCLKQNRPEQVHLYLCKLESQPLQMIRVSFFGPTGGLLLGESLSVWWEGGIFPKPRSWREGPLPAAAVTHMARPAWKNKKMGKERWAVVSQGSRHHQNTLFQEYGSTTTGKYWKIRSQSCFYRLMWFGMLSDCKFVQQWHTHLVSLLTVSLNTVR